MGLDKSATHEDIIKVYKRLIIRCHPDKGHDPKIFKEIQKAYNVLSDPKKKKIYDEYGEEGLTDAEIGEDSDLFNIFSCGTPPTNKNLKKKCKEKLVELSITLEDSYNGEKKEIEYDRRIICPKCKDVESSYLNENNTCLKCNGSGMRIITMQNKDCMDFNSQQECDECNGEGKIIKEKCQECEGNKVKNIKRKMEINLEKGVPDGHRYSIANEGDEFPDFETGDLIVAIVLQKHKDFIRKGADLLYKCKISLLESLIGFNISFNHLDGRRILIESNPDKIIQPETLKTVEGLGMPFFNSPDKYGNLYIDFKIVFPDKLDKDQKKNLCEILKNEKINIVDDLSKDIEKYHLVDYNEEKINSDYNGGKKGDLKGESDNENEEGDNNKEVNCANQ